MGDEQQATEGATRLANIWAGRHVSIRGQVGGSICVDEDGMKVKTATGGNASRFVIEQGPLPNTVAFRVLGTQKYLTNIMYGDKHRQHTAEVLAAVPVLLPVHIPALVDYAIGRPTDETNFEGPGFNYNPMNAQDGPPTKLQLFELESVQDSARHSLFGVKSLFGTYWRSQWWDHTVSQSPNLLGDETWSFDE